MGETILFQLVKVVNGQLRSTIVQEVQPVLGVKYELERMSSNLYSIHQVLPDAEKKQTTCEPVKNWLGKLQDVLYDIDDLLDGIITEVTIQNKIQSQWLDQVRKLFSRTNSLALRWQMQWVGQIRSLCEKLDLIASQRNALLLSTEPVYLASREIYYNVRRSGILGRNDDKEAIINSILNCGDCESLSVLPIVGVCGIGKTAFARLIFNDSRINDSFDKKMRVGVPQKFHINILLKEVISIATGEGITRITAEQLSLEQLRLKTSEAFKDKRYFLILDGLCNQDSDEWSKVKELLDVGAKGSVVIVTTRDVKVASIVQTVGEYQLPELSHETLLKILFKLVDVEDDEEVDPTRLDVANKIVEKSKGLPLLLINLVSLLCGEPIEYGYHVIQKLEQGHEDIMEILKLSYDQLPSHFKLCFRIFPILAKDLAIIPYSELFPLWTALGFLPIDDQGEALARTCL